MGVGPPGRGLCNLGLAIAYGRSLTPSYFPGKSFFALGPSTRANFSRSRDFGFLSVGWFVTGKSFFATLCPSTRMNFSRSRVYGGRCSWTIKLKFELQIPSAFAALNCEPNCRISSNFNSKIIFPPIAKKNAQPSKLFSTATRQKKKQATRGTTGLP